MGFTPRGVGDASLIHSTFTTDSGTFSLSGISESALAMHFIDTSTATMRVGTGTWTITGANTADYAPSADDVAMPGMFRLYPVIQLSTGPKAFDPQLLSIENWP